MVWCGPWILFGVAVAAAGADEGAVLDCPPTPRPMVVDGVLDDWAGVPRHSVSAVPPIPEAEIGGEFAFSYTDDSLYVCGEIHDDQILPPAEWGGLDLSLEDGSIVLYFDLDPDDEPGADFDADGVHLLLRPLHPQRSWEVLRWRGGVEPGTIHLSGVEVVSQEVSPDKWRFEARIPWANLGHYPRQGASIGFELELRDRDRLEHDPLIGEPLLEDASVLRLGEAGGPVSSPADLLRLEFSGSPRDFSRDLESTNSRRVFTGVLAVLAVLGVLGVMGTSSQRIHRFLRPRGRHWRVFGLIVVASVGLGLWALPDVWSEIQAWRAKGELVDSAERLETAFADFRKDPALSERLVGADHEVVRDLLEGRGYRSRGSYRFEPLQVSSNGPFEYSSVLEDGSVPFVEYGVLVGAEPLDPESGDPELAGPVQLRLSTPVAASRVHLALTAFLPEGLSEVSDGLRVDFQFDTYTNASHQLFTLRDTRVTELPEDDPQWLGLADERGGFGGPWDDAQLAVEVEGRPLRHVHHLVYEVPDNFHSASEAGLVGITLSRTEAARDAVVWLSAITVQSGLASIEYHPLSLGGNDPDGFPTPMRAGRMAPRERRVQPGRSVVFPVGEDAALALQRLRIYYRPERGALFSTPADEGQVRAVVEVGVRGQPEPLLYQLRTSIEVAEEVPADGRLPDTYRCFVAGSYESAVGRRHYTGYELPIAEDRPAPVPVESVTVHVPVDAGGAFCICGLTAAIEVKPAPPPAGSPFEEVDGELVLADEIVEFLGGGGDGRGFAIVEEGRIQSLSSSTDSELAALLRGTSAGLDAASPEEPPTEGAADVRARQRAGRDFLETSVALPFSDGQWRLRIWTEVTGRDRVERIRDLTALVLALLALPLGLMLLVDWLTRVTRIRSRLSMLFLVISAAPLSVMFLILVNIVVDEQKSDETDRAHEILGLADERIHSLASAAETFAGSVHRELESGALLDDPESSAEDIRALLEAKATEFAAGGTVVQIRAQVSSEGSGGETLFFYSSPYGRSDRRWLAARDGLSLSAGSLVYSGSRSTDGLEVQVAGVVGDEELEALALRGAEESLAMLSPRLQVSGGPAEDAGTRAIEGGTVLVRSAQGSFVDRSEAESVARQLDRGEGRVEHRDAQRGTRAYDLMRSDSGEPIAMIRAQVKRSALTVDLGVFQVELLWLVLVLGAVTLACALFLGSVVTEGITRPLDRIQLGARALAEGKEAVTVLPQGDDEVAELAQSFNRMSSELRRRIRDQEMMSAATGVLTRTLQLSERVDVALEFLHETIPSRSMTCYLYSSGRDELSLEGVRLEPSEGMEPPPPKISNPDGPLREALTTSDPLFIEELSAHESWPRATAEEREGLGSGPVLLLPLGRSSQPTGVVVLHPRNLPPLREVEEAFLRNLLAQFSVALENARLYRHAVEDHETGLFVHSYFAGRVGEEIDRAITLDRALTLLLLAVQEVAPALSGDDRRAWILSLARALRRSCSDREIVARREGLEFEVMITEDGAERADTIVREFAENVREEGHEATADSITHAIVRFPEDGRSREFLFDAMRDRLGGGHGSDSSGVFERIARRAPQFVFRSVRMAPVLEQVERVAASDATLLILGETGTGKEVIAHLAHQLSGRRDGPFIAVHCAALPDNLLEAELFGHEKGAFTGADRLREGHFEAAKGGTLFLDEVAEIPLFVQVKLLRVLQERRVQRLGGTGEVPIDVRLVAATHRSLEQMVEDESFREDLYYRLQVVTVSVPPLRERWEELPSLVELFLEEHHKEDGARTVTGIEPAALDLLRQHHWPGNVRELRNVIQRALVLGQGDQIQKDDIEWGRGADDSRPAAVAPPMPTTPQSVSAPEPPEQRSGGERDAHGELNERQRMLLELLSQRGRVTSREYCEAAGLSRRTALRDLQVLMHRGLILRQGSRKAAVYRLR